MTVLVTGARGNIGSRLITCLLRGGHHVRASTRDVSGPGLPPGVETTALDVTEPVDAAAALQGVESVFLYPARGGIERFLDAAGNAGVEHIVLLSSPASFAAHEHDRPIGRIHRVLEQSLENSGLPHTLLYPSWLATNAIRDWAGQIRATGSVALPFPDAEFTPIDPEDVAEVAAHLLTRVEHRARIQVLTGPESLRLRDIVGILGEVLETPISVRASTRQQALDNRPPWLPEAVLGALLDAEQGAVGVTAPVNNEVERVTGRPPRTFRGWAERHREAFSTSGS